MRQGQATKLDARLLVPGDIVLLAVGDKVPADCRLIKITSSSFKVDQAILTGEPFSISKVTDLILTDAGAVKQDQLNMLFSGTSVTVGKALAVVVQTGENTALGEIHQSISSQIEEKTPLKIALDEFGEQLARIITVICILVWLINIRHFSDEAFGGSWVKGSVYYFKIAVALAVAAIPEGLAVIITTCLALGTQKMAAQGAIVRKLRSVETLGCTSVICSDKTGTLTTNQMSVRRIATFDKPGRLDELSVIGNTYAPIGHILLPNGVHADRNILTKNPVLTELSHIASLCNDSKIVYDQALNVFQKVGEPTEAAMKTLVEKMGSDDATFNSSIPYLTEESLAALSPADKLRRASQVEQKILEQYTVGQTLEFSRDRKSMSVIVERKVTTGYFTRRSPELKRILYVKGAPETVLDRCTHIRTSSSYDKPVALTPEIRESILAKVTLWGEADSLRVLALATVDRPVIPDQLEASDFAKYESGMTFVGLVGMLDPPRPEVRGAIAKCRQAGIRVIVITGDNKKTAESICKAIGVFEDDEDLTGKSFTGREFDSLTEDEKLNAVMHASLFSRTEPTHKSQLVDLLKRQGLIVAMTGDGVNDAPALKKADIGIAMGSGTDVAKLASDMVLADDNFSTIVSAVEEGRSIYSNTKQFIRYLISSNIGEVVSIFLTVLLGMPEALIPVQLLWVNLVTDGLPATALGFNPADNDIMYQAPRDSKEPIVTPWLFFRYCVIGMYVGCATIFGYAWWFVYNVNGPQISLTQLTNFHSCSKEFAEIGCEMFTNEMSHKATTMSLSILVVVEMFNAVNRYSSTHLVFQRMNRCCRSRCGAICTWWVPLCSAWLCTL